jgi:NADPH2:quinone reductase
MRAIRLHAFGPPENLVYEELPDPMLAEEQVRIRVEAAGVHLIDTAIRRGVAWGPFPLPDLPMVPGREVAGTVEAIGPHVDERWLGRRVVAHLGMASGGYAERAVSPVPALHEIPHHLAADAAVATIGTGRTAVAILDLARPSPEDVVLVTAAAGGLGSLLVQGARNAGSLVVGVAGGRAKVDLTLALGAHIAVDYLGSDWPQRVRAALGHRTPSLLLDGVGGTQGRAALELLGSGGRLVLFGWSSGEPTPFTAADLSERGLAASELQRPADLRPLEERALNEAAAGRLAPLVGQHVPLADAAAAHRAIESRATVGKTVLVP